MPASTRTRPGDPVYWPATVQRAALAAGEISSVELLDLHLARVDAHGGTVNAIVQLDREGARATALASDAARAAGEPLGALSGLPLAAKDTDDAAGLRTTYGSPLFAENVPERDSTVVSRVRVAGAVIVGKTNIPEFAAGSHSTNPLFGTTTNPYDASRSAGGSSGGAAAALASGMVALATGSDMGGSLRNPASFCNVVGLRPSPGLVPLWPAADPWQSLLVSGPLARTVADAALLLSVLAGSHPDSPLTAQASGSVFAKPLDRDLAGIRVGWSRSLGGLDIDPEVTEVLDQQSRPALGELGASVVDLEPDIGEFDDVFRDLRAIDFADAFGELVRRNPGRIGSDFAHNVELGATMTIADFTRARRRRGELFRRFSAVFSGGDAIDVLAAPVAPVPPFPAIEPWVREINGVPQRDYLEWMRAAWRISPTGFAALSVPGGFTTHGLPIGLQLIAAPGRERLLLELGHEFERRRPFWAVHPPL